jgi:hypothetical protein
VDGRRRAASVESLTLGIIYMLLVVDDFALRRMPGVGRYAARLVGMRSFAVRLVDVVDLRGTLRRLRIRLADIGVPVRIPKVRELVCVFLWDLQLGAGLHPPERALEVRVRNIALSDLDGVARDDLRLLALGMDESVLDRIVKSNLPCHVIGSF